MSKMYLIVYDGLKPPRPAFIHWLDQQPKVLNWHATTFYPLFVVLWDGALVELRDSLKTGLGMDTFVAVEAGPDKIGKEIEGWLPQATWDFIRKNEPKVLPTELSTL